LNTVYHLQDTGLEINVKPEMTVLTADKFTPGEWKFLYYI